MINSVLEICEMVKSVEIWGEYSWYDWTLRRAYKGRHNEHLLGCDFTTKYSWVHIDYDEDGINQKKYKKYSEMINWCQENLFGAFGIGYKLVPPDGLDASMGFIFESKDDALAFILRWSE